METNTTTPLFSTFIASNSVYTATTGAVLFLLLTSLFFLLSSKESHKRRLLPPGPAPWPIVGSLVTLLRNRPHFRWILGIADGKDITCIRLGPVHAIVVNCPELAREFLGKHDANFASRPITLGSEYSGRGFVSVVISPWGEQWKKMRRMVASEILSLARLRSETDLRHQEADHLVRYIYNQCRKGDSSSSAPVDVRLAVRYYCGTVIRRMIFGCRWFGEGGIYDGPGKEELEHVDAAIEVLSIVYSFCVSDFIPALRFLDIYGHERAIKKAVGVIDKYHDPIIDERVEMWRSGRKKEVEDGLDIMISLKDGNGKPLLTVEEIKAQSAVKNLTHVFF